MARAPARLVLIALPLLVLGALVARYAGRLVLTAWGEYVQFHPRREAVPLPPDVAALGFRAVAFVVPEVGTIRGWYAPACNGASVVFTHGTGSDRRAGLAVARALVGGGYGALLFDWPGHGESEGAVRFGAPERRALAAAVDYVRGQPDVAGGRVGVYGFSIGAFLAAQVAATDERVRALVLAAPFGDAEALTRHMYAAKGRAGVWGALLGERLGGMRHDDPQPIALVGRIAPRPLLIVTGTADGTTTPAMARDLFEAAREPKRLWLVEGAGHGGYEQVMPDFGAGVRGFFDGALAPPGGPRRGCR